MSLTVGSLFSGIGGLDLGLERAGMSVKWQAEVDPYCSRVLAKHWPDVPNLGDVTKIEWETVERVDLICGGFPCQPVSYAGARAGSDDARWLWPEFVRCLRVLRPRFALLENVPGLLTLGFGEVAADLAALGYDYEWDCIPAAAVGAPHLRYRVVVVADAGSEQHESSRVAIGRSAPALVPADTDGGRLEERGERDLVAAGRQRTSRRDDARRLRASLADTDRETRSAPWSSSEAVHGPATEQRPRRRRGVLGDPFGPPSDALAAFRRSWGAASESGWWATEPDVGRVAHGVPSRVDRLRALGNAVVPQVAEFVGRALLASLLPQGVPGVTK